MLVLGDMDPAYYVGNISWLPLTEPAWYCVNMVDLLLDNVSLDIKLSGACPTVVDSGTTLLVIPRTFP